MKRALIFIGLVVGLTALTAGVRNGRPYHKTVFVQHVSSSTSTIVRPGFCSSFGEVYMTTSTAAAGTLTYYLARGGSVEVALVVPSGGVMDFKWYGPRYDSLRVSTPAASGTTVMAFKD